MRLESNSKVIKSDGYQWQGVERKDYKSDDSVFEGVHRYTLLGPGSDEQTLNFETRYFEVEASGYTSLEYHRHPHSVVIIRGSGTVIMGDKMKQISAFDTVFIAPDTLHQFQADRGEPLGFICVVDRYRDRPTLPTDKEISQITDERIQAKIKR